MQLAEDVFMKAFRWICAILLVIGALNWGILGLFNVNVLEMIFGMNAFTRLLYVLVGLAGLIKLARLFGCCSCKCGCGPNCSGCSTKKR
jgi:hypothetical protein